MGEASAAAPAAFDAAHRGLTLGILLGVTLFAFENLAVITIAPRIAEALSGERLYGWLFSGFLLASLLGAALGGSETDRRGPAWPFALGLGLFGTGLLAAGFAPGMGLLLLARVLQGLGGGMMVSALYAAVNRAYPDALRARVVALMSSAWVLPALLGPAVAGVLAETVGWRVVFWGLTPVLALAALLSLGAMHRLKPKGGGARGASLPLAGLLVVGALALLVALELRSWALAFPLALVGLSVAGLALRRLLPEGALRLAPGLPSVVAARGLFYAAFVGVETFLALMLTGVHGLAASLAGVVIASGAISWTVGSWTQDRLERRGAQQRPQRVLWGSLLLGVGLGAQLLALFAPLPPLALALAGWVLAGFGIGLAHSTSSVLAFALAPVGEEGAVSAALQLADQFTSAISTGAGGALLALALGLGLGTRGGVLLAFSFSLVLAALAVFAAARIADSSPPPYLS